MEASGEGRDRSAPSGSAAGQRLRQLRALTEAALTHLTLDDLLGELLGRIRDLLAVDTVAVLLLDEERGELVARAAKGLEEEVEAGSRVPLRRGFAGRVAAERRAIRIRDLETAGVVNPILRRRGIASLLGVPLIVERQVIGVLHVGSLTPRDFTDEDAELLQLAADRIALAVDHARLYEAERDERRRAEAAYEQLARLEAITSSALSNLTVDEVLHAQLERLPALLESDSVTVMLLDDDGGQLAVRAARGLSASGLDTRVALGEGFAGGIAQSGRPAVVADVPASDVAADDPLATDAGSLMGVPLRLGDDVIGVVVAGRRSRNAFDAATLDLLHKAADRLAAAVDRARLLESEQRARASAERAIERLRRIESISQVALANLAVDEELLGTLLGRVRDILRADTATVLLVRGDALEPYVARGLEEEVGQGVRVPLGRGFAGRVAATRSPVAIDELTPESVVNPILRDSGVRSLLGVPLTVADRLLGVLHVGARQRRRFSDEDTVLLQLAADRIAVALDHSSLYERERRIAETLQRSLLPERLPTIAGLELVGRYVPGSPEADIGGDWYDVIPLEGGRVGLAIGDVVSRGIKAASTMGQLRNALRAYAIDSSSPATVLERLDNAIRGLPERDMATLLYMVVDPAARTYELANAGHPPPIVVADGRAARLEGGRAPPLGAGMPVARADASGELPAGATLLLYTDGIVESRAVELEVGTSRLEQAVAQAGAIPLARTLDDILDRLLPDLGGSDDVALLAVALPARAGSAIRLELPADPDSLAGLRRQLRDWLGASGASEQEAYDIVVAASEAAANAVEHAYGPVDATFTVEAELSAREVSIVVSDRGSWRPPRGRNRGRGTLLMQELMDAFAVRTSDAGTAVRMTRRLERPLIGLPQPDGDRVGSEEAT